MGEDFDVSTDFVELSPISKSLLDELCRTERALTDAIRERNLWRGLTVVLGLGELALLAFLFGRAAPWG